MRVSRLNHESCDTIVVYFWRDGERGRRERKPKRKKDKKEKKKMKKKKKGSSTTDKTKTQQQTNNIISFSFIFVSVFIHCFFFVRTVSATALFSLSLFVPPKTAPRNALIVLSDDWRSTMRVSVRQL